MRLLELNIENYGLYTSRHFEFDNSFVLIHGPNEAGKSTLLQLIRELLFGFPHQSPYVYESHTGKLAATARIELKDDRCVRFRRHKGTKNTVTGEIEGTLGQVDEQLLSELLSGASGELFEHIFGFSLSELAAGEKSLQNANLNEALYGSGIGGLANFQRVQETVRDEHVSLFSPRGKRPAINRLVETIRQQSKELRDAAVKPRDYSVLRDDVEAVEAEAERLRQALDELRRQATRLERLETARETWTKLEIARAEWKRIPERAGVPRDGAGKLRQLLSRLKELDIETKRLQSDLECKRAGASALQLANEIMAAEARIRTLQQDVGRMRSFVTDIPLRQQESDALKQQVLTRIAELNPDWSFDDLGRFQSSLASRDVVQQLAERLSQLDQRDAAISSQRTELQRHLDVVRQRLSSDDNTKFLPGLEDIVERSRNYLNERDQLAELRRSHTQLENEIKSTKSKLTSTVAWTSEEDSTRSLASLPVPLVATAEEYQKRIASAERSAEQLVEKCNGLKSDLGEQKQLLQDITTKTTIIDRDDLLKQRSQRDEAWTLIRTKYIEAADDDKLPWNKVPLPEEYERDVAAADNIADERQKNAEVVARQEQLSKSIERLRNRIADCEENVAAATAQQAGVDREWRELWSECQINPRTATEMLDWLAIHGELLEATHRSNDLEARITQLTDVVDLFESELARNLPTSLNSADASLAEARVRLDAARDAASERKRLQAELPELEARSQALDNDQCQLTMQQAEWQSRWKSALNEFGFPESWNVNTATRILTELSELRQKHGESASLEKRIADMQTELTQFQSQTRALCADVASDLCELPPTDAIVELASRLDAAKHAAVEQATLTAEINELERRSSAKVGQQTQFTTERSKLLQQAESSSEDEFFQFADVAQRRYALEEEIDSCERTLRAVSGKSDLQSFLGESPDDMPAQRQRLSEQIALVERDYRTALKDAGAKRDKLQELDTETRTLQLAAELESSRSELSTAVDRWAPLVLTEYLMSRAIKKFEQEHQPRMLNEVSRLFSQMTAGRYVGIQRKLDEHGTLLVEEVSGDLKEPSTLSTGTREQLYLAIRLAFVTQYCEESEPLPLVMDDVLVNFDDERARSTLKVLVDVSKTVQILFLTCHQHIVDRIAEIAGNCRPLELSTSYDTDHFAVTQPAALPPSMPDPPRPHIAAESTRVQTELFPDS